MMYEVEENAREARETRGRVRVSWRSELMTGMKGEKEGLL